MNAKWIIFDPQAGGHHPEFIRYLWELCRGQPGAGTCLFMVTRPVSELACDGPRNGCQVMEIPAGLVPDDGLSLPSPEMVEGQLQFIRQAAGEQSGPVRCFFPRINPYLGSLAVLAAKTGQCAGVSGILFNPQSAAWVHGGQSAGDYLRGLVELFRIRKARRHGNLERLYLLNDPRTARRLTRWSGLPGKILPLADPVPELPRPTISLSQVRENLGIRSSATLFLLPGVLRAGKGVLEAIEAFSQWRPVLDKEAVLLLAGNPSPAFREQLEDRVAKFSAQSGRVDLKYLPGFLEKERLAEVLETADFVILPYRNVLGSSGFVGLAAGRRKPILANGSGLLGELVRSGNLGRTFRLEKPYSIIETLNMALSGQVTADPEAGRHYLERNSAEAFKRQLGSLLSSS